MHMLCIGVLLGMLVTGFAPSWVKALVFVAAVLFSGLLVTLSAHSHGHVSTHMHVSPLLIALGGVAFGVWSWHYARWRGLQHLAIAEARNRWALARGVSKWGW